MGHERSGDINDVLTHILGGFLHSAGDASKKTHERQSDKSAAQTLTALSAVAKKPLDAPAMLTIVNEKTTSQNQITRGLSFLHA
ncbi:hypothetical protein [Pseudomonas asturiensis]|uniref:hypothetical protein n=1 Tax=Pseudomonas asturiensis TaxID=1190415 RepID=UPI001588028F|nr:hypothetical protein [Pseudomonas asturiensis]